MAVWISCGTDVLWRDEDKPYRVINIDPFSEGDESIWIRRPGEQPICAHISELITVDNEKVKGVLR